MSERITFGEEEPHSFDKKLLNIVGYVAGNLENYLRDPTKRARAIGLAAAIMTLPSGCAQQPDQAMPPPEIATTSGSETIGDDEGLTTVEDSLRTDTNERTTNEEVATIEDSLLNETGVAVSSIVESLRAKCGFEGEMVIKQVNYLPEEGYMGVSIAFAGDPLRGELSQAGALAIYKISQDKTLVMLDFVDEIDETGQLAAPPKPAEISEERWRSLLYLDYRLEGKVNKIN